MTDEHRKRRFSTFCITLIASLTVATLAGTATAEQLADEPVRVPKVLLFIIALLFLLAGCVVWGVLRKLRGGTFFPPPNKIDGIDQPQTLEGVARQRREEKEQKKKA